MIMEYKFTNKDTILQKNSVYNKNHATNNKKSAIKIQI